MVLQKDNDKIDIMSSEIKKLQKMLLKFRKERNWRKFHTPRNLAISLAIEVSEVLEHFQWKTEEEIEEYIKDREKQQELGEEIADVAIYLLLLANETNIDIKKAVENKIKKNDEKYPENKVRGLAKKYTEFERE